MCIKNPFKFKKKKNYDDNNDEDLFSTIQDIHYSEPLGVWCLSMSQIAGTIGKMASMGGGVFLRDPNSYYANFGEKPWKTLKQLGQHAQPGIEPGISCLPALSTEPLSNWWGQNTRDESFSRFFVSSTLIILQNLRKYTIKM